MSNQRRFAIKILASLGATAVLPSIAWGQKAVYPSDTVSLVVPFGAGGSTDHLARVVAVDMNARHSGKFIVDNRPGAGATIGTRAVANASRDGRTLLYSTATPFSINPFVYQTLPYDPVKSFVPIALTVQLPTFLAVSKESGFKTLQDLIDYLRKNPQRSSFSSYGKGTSSHIAGALFAKKIGVPGVLHVPYNDTRAMSDLVSGRNTFQTDAWSVLSPMVAAGKLVVLASCGTERMPWVPNVPTVTSVIGDEYDMSTWHGLFAPTGTPVEILDFLNQEVKTTMAKDSVQKAALEQGFKPYPYMSRKEVGAFVANDVARWGRYIELAGIERQ